MSKERTVIEQTARLQDAIDALQMGVLIVNGHMESEQSKETFRRKARSGIVGIEDSLARPAPAEVGLDLPARVVVGANGAYWRDFGTHYSMCPVSEDNDPVQPVAIYVRDYVDPALDAARPAPAEPLPAGHPDTWPGGTMHMPKSSDCPFCGEWRDNPDADCAMCGLTPEPPEGQDPGRDASSERDDGYVRADVEAGR